MKYIIEIPDNDDRFLTHNDELAIPVTVGLDEEFAYETGLKVKSYEPDRKAIEYEVWEMARLIALEVDDGGLKPSELYRCFGYGSIQDVMKTHSYQDVKAKYEAWSKQNIREGDEVIYDSRTKAVVLIPETKERYGTILTSEFATISVSHDDLEKTGRHFEDVAEVLKKMKGD